MSLGDFRQALAASPQLGLRFRLPTGSLTPIHLHLTEVARVEKRYIDCGGTIRTDVSARLQLWAADDTDHRVGCAKALLVLDRGAALVGGPPCLCCFDPAIVHVRSGMVHDGIKSSIK